jgi:hypothetical protein
MPGGRSDIRDRSVTVAMHLLRRMLLRGVGAPSGRVVGAPSGGGVGAPSGADAAERTGTPVDSPPAETP